MLTINVTIYTTNLMPNHTSLWGPEELIRRLDPLQWQITIIWLKWMHGEHFWISTINYFANMSGKYCMPILPSCRSPLPSRHRRGEKRENPSQSPLEGWLDPAMLVAPVPVLAQAREHPAPLVLAPALARPVACRQHATATRQKCPCQPRRSSEPEKDRIIHSLTITSTFNK